MSSICFAFGKEEDHLGYFQKKRFRQKYATIVSTLQTISVLLSDSLICWRLYVVWNRRKAILLVPILLLIALTGSGSMFTAFSFIGAQQGATGFPKYETCLTVTGFISLSVNIVVTILICWKIWRIGREIPTGMEMASKRYHSVMHALIESGGIYSVVVIFFIAFRLSGWKATSIFVSYIVPQVTGIAPTMIVIRLHNLPLQQPHQTESTPPHQYQNKASSELISMETANWANCHNLDQTHSNASRGSAAYGSLSIGIEGVQGIRSSKSCNDAESVNGMAVDSIM
ncbi:hypothetical protein FRC03_012459 [Tulasnella sp. 419]|nr:hypothetical protein FRC03_012459 [Tulasnella sp. 419]